MVTWEEIIGFALIMVGVLIMPVLALQQAYSSLYFGFPVAIALMIGLTDAGVYVHSHAERRGLQAV